MGKIIIDGINILNPIEGKMEKIIDAFVEYYGEEYRPRIEEKLKSAQIYFVGQSVGFDKTTRVVSRYYNQKLYNLEIDFWREAVGDECAEKVKKSFLLIGHRLGDIENDISENRKPIGIDDLLTILGYFLPDNYNARSAVLDNIIKDKRLHNKILEKVKNLNQLWQEKYQKEYDNINNESKSKVEFVQQIMNYDKENEEYCKLAVKDFFNKKISKYIDGYENLSKYKQQDLIDIFKDYMSNKKFITDYDKNKYISFFENLGFKHNNFDEYINDPKFKEIFNEQLYNDYNDLQKNLTIQRVKNNPFIINIIKDLQSEGKVFGINDFAKDLYSFIYGNSSIGGFVEYLKVNGNLRDVCILPQALKLADNLLFHEFGHIIEGDKIEGCNNKSISGFDILTINEEDCTFNVEKIYSDKSKAKSENSTRKYELLNEVINDYFSIQVTNIYNKKNDKIGLDGEFVSSYSFGFPLLKDFIEENKDVLVKSRLTQDHQYFARIIGQENFDKLADCVTEFLSINELTRSDIYKSIKNKTGIKGIGELKNFDKFDCEWNEQEQTIVDAFKTVREIRNIIAKAKIKENREEQGNEKQENE